MNDDLFYQKSLIEQIYDEMFSRISRRDEFDLQTVQNLRRLFGEGKLVGVSQIVEAVQATVKKP
jgi:hypothetical protein